MLSIRRLEGRFQLRSNQWFPCDVDAIFPFFADPSNLQSITPDWLDFRIVSELPPVMTTGLRLQYRLSLHGLPVFWETEIECWKPPRMFVDVQRRGPYRLWRHEHRFEPKDGGTLMVDTVDYSMPFGPLAHALFVKRDLVRIFSYRQQVLRARFGAEPRPSQSVPV